MDDTLDAMIREWDGMAVIHSYDPPTRSRIFIALHDARLGMPVGGTRMKSYPAPTDALRDALRLAEGMTFKWAGIDFDFGGGKCVVDVPEPLTGEARTGFFRRYGRLLEALDGAFATGVDLGTDPADMDVAARETRFIFGSVPDGQGTVDPGPYTALGVLRAMQAATAHRFGTGDLADRRVLVQGVGDVGEPLARMLAEAGVDLLLSDVDGDRLERLAGELGAGTVPADDPYATECDVFAPCAVGGVLDDETIPRLRCAIIAGSANNQLEAPAHADALLERGILYAPDYVANAGGALSFGLLQQGIRDEEQLRQRVDGLGDRVAEIFAEADERGESPLAAARRLAERKLEAGPGRKDAGAAAPS